VNDEQLLRYARQILLPQIDLAGQERLAQARVVIVGLGGLGAPVAMYLAAAGVGTLVLVDDDKVELSNLQRQIIHTHAALETPKVTSASTRLQAINPHLEVLTYHQHIQPDNAEQLAQGADLLMDCSDSLQTRLTLNQLSLKQSLPLVSGAAIALQGQVTVFDPRQAGSPCYACLYAQQEEMPASCAENGVLGPLVGIIGAMQALEALKLLVGFGTTLVGRLLVFDGQVAEWQHLRLAPNPQCSVCAADKQNNDKDK